MNKLERFNLVRKIKLNLSDIKPNKMEEGEGLEGACWEGYEPIGTHYRSLYCSRYKLRKP